MPTTLSEHPKSALNIIEFISTFNSVEMTLYRALGLLLGDETGMVTEAILSKIDSIAYKQNVIFDVARLQPKGNALCEAILAAEPVLRRATKLRNELAHGVYAQDEDKDLVILGNMFSFGKKPLKIEKFDRQKVVDLCNEVTSATLKINKVFGGLGVNLHGGAISGTMRTEHREKDPGETAA